jgi:hypothetical protein
MQESPRLGIDVQRQDFHNATATIQVDDEDASDFAIVG